jgi:hypothetical protein
MPHADYPNPDGEHLMLTKHALHCDYPGCTAESPIEPPPPEPAQSMPYGRQRRYIPGKIHEGWLTVPAVSGRPAALYCPEHAAVAEGGIRRGEGWAHALAVAKGDAPPDEPSPDKPKAIIVMPIDDIAVDVILFSESPPPGRMVRLVRDWVRNPPRS